MDQKVKALIEEALSRGFGVYLTCGGFASNGPEFKDKVKRWLDRNGLDSSQIKLVSKRKTVMVLDDHAIRYEGQDLVGEFKKRANKLDNEGSPDVR